ncbi:DUF2510 domain-containing protein [Glaciihabitans sp. UYNi722]|uniref:DUF2510 domain-containing protein n=1 Tax=Glaciihabitans sp. UYNi722 TaxID=3156344 RepID=UPI0033937B29
MFEDDVSVPAGWYPDPMGLPQLRWWNNHAWTELTTEARPPLVMQQPTRLTYADEELPTRRQQREQRERDEQYARLATDESEARDAANAQAPLTVTLRELEPPLPATVEAEEPAPVAREAVPAETAAAAAVTIGETLVVDPVEPHVIDEDTLDSDEEVVSAFVPRSAATAVSAPSHPHPHPHPHPHDSVNRMPPHSPGAPRRRTAFRSTPRRCGSSR